MGEAEAVQATELRDAKGRWKPGAGRWKPGESGNPSGRPKSAPSPTAALRTALGKDRAALRAIVEAVLRVAGDPQHKRWADAVRLVFDRVDGAVLRQTLVTGETSKRVILTLEPSEGVAGSDRSARTIEASSQPVAPQQLGASTSDNTQYVAFDQPEAGALLRTPRSTPASDAPLPPRSSN